MSSAGDQANDSAALRAGLEERVRAVRAKEVDGLFGLGR